MIKYKLSSYNYKLINLHSIYLAISQYWYLLLALLSESFAERKPVPGAAAFSSAPLLLLFIRSFNLTRDIGGCAVGPPLSLVSAWRLECARS